MTKTTSSPKFSVGDKVTVDSSSAPMKELLGTLSTLPKKAAAIGARYTIIAIEDDVLVAEATVSGTVTELRVHRNDVLKMSA